MSTLIELEAGLRRLLAPNPSPMTFTGTNTYLLGQGPFAVIDPGPADAAHLEAIFAATGGDVSHILVTHAHLDHSPLAPELADRTGAPVLAFGDAGAGRSAIMERLAASGAVGGGEGVDTAFHPDHCLEDGAVIDGVGWSLEALWTPGHFGNHLAFRWDDRVFCGDLVMGWASSLVSPPDGDLAQFLSSCARLKSLEPARLYAGHGEPIEDPVARIDWLVSHRQTRSDQIHAALAGRPMDAASLAAQIYTDIPVQMLPAASRNVLAHLIDFYQQDLVSLDEELTVDSVFHWR